MKLLSYISPLLITVLFCACDKDPEPTNYCYTCPPQVPDTSIHNPPLDLLVGQTWAITQYSIQNQINPISNIYLLSFDDSSNIKYTFQGDSTSHYYVYKPQPLNKYTLRLDNTPWGNIQTSYLTDYNFNQGQIPGAEFVNINSPNFKVYLWIQKL